MVWNINIPAGSESVSYGDDRIRELKQDLENIFQEDHYFLTDNNFPRLVHSITKNKHLRERIFYEDNLLKYRDSEGRIIFWEDYIPIGTKILFHTMPQAGRPYWNIVPIVGYVANIVDSNGGIIAGLVDFFVQNHTHSVESVNIEGHQHSVSFGSTSQNQGSDIKENVSKTSGTKFVRYGHTHDGFSLDSTKSENITHNHTLSNVSFYPRYINCLVLERIK